MGQREEKMEEQRRTHETSCAASKGIEIFKMKDENLRSVLDVENETDCQKDLLRHQKHVATSVRKRRTRR